jgi:uncharacterized cupin superfamily protein
LTNLNSPDFDEPRDHPGFVAKRARVSRQAGAVSLGLSQWEVPAGQAAYPYHFHLAEEELLIVLDGSPTLRTPQGTRRLEPGEVVAFLVGAEGAHQLVNDTGETVRFLCFSPSGMPDVVLYPDSDKVGAFERRPDGSGLRTMFRMGDAVD